jgi:Tfp pilus assembly protein PilF
MALCQQKLGQYRKAEELYLYALDKRPNDIKIMGALFKMYNEDVKDYTEAQKYIELLLNEV